MAEFVIWDWMHDCTLSPEVSALPTRLTDGVRSLLFRVDCDWDIGSPERLTRFLLELRGISSWRLDLQSADGSILSNVELAEGDDFTVLTSQSAPENGLRTIFGDVSVGGQTGYFGTLQLSYEDDRVLLSEYGPMPSSQLVALLDEHEAHS